MAARSTKGKPYRLEAENDWEYRVLDSDGTPIGRIIGDTVQSQGKPGQELIRGKLRSTFTARWRPFDRNDLPLANTAMGKFQAADRVWEDFQAPKPEPGSREDCNRIVDLLFAGQGAWGTFANLLGVNYSTVMRYKSGEQPYGAAIVMLLQIAERELRTTGRLPPEIRARLPGAETVTETTRKQGVVRRMTAAGSDRDEIAECLGLSPSQFDGWVAANMPGFKLQAAA